MFSGALPKKYKMSQVTLVTDHDYKPFQYHKVESEKVRESLHDQASDSTSEEGERYDPPVIHMLTIHDTMKSICQKYVVPVIVEFYTRPS